METENAVISAEGAEVMEAADAITAGIQEEELTIQEITYTIKVYADTREDAVSFIDELLEDQAEVDSYAEVAE
jgi:hypothetical protein